MQNYEELLNGREGKTIVNIQGIYDMIYASKIDAYTINNFCSGIMLMDEAVTHNGVRALIQFKEIGEKDVKEMTLGKLDPQLREVMVICFRYKHKVRDESIGNDYRHLGLSDYKGRLYLEYNLTMPSDGRRAGDLSELGIAMREKLKLYK